MFFEELLSCRMSHFCFFLKGFGDNKMKGKHMCLSTSCFELVLLFFVFCFLFLFFVFSCKTFWGEFPEYNP